MRKYIIVLVITSAIVKELNKVAICTPIFYFNSYFCIVYHFQIHLDTSVLQKNKKKQRYILIIFGALDTDSWTESWMNRIMKQFSLRLFLNYLLCEHLLLVMNCSPWLFVIQRQPKNCVLHSNTNMNTHFLVYVHGYLADYTHTNLVLLYQGFKYTIWKGKCEVYTIAL